MKGMQLGMPLENFKKLLNVLLATDHIEMNQRVIARAQHPD